jgi:hypothetical protein
MSSTIRLSDRATVGSFRRKVTLEHVQTPAERGATGEQIKTYVPYYTGRAAMSSLIGWEKTAGAVNIAVQTHLVRLPYCRTLWDALKSSDRVTLYDGGRTRIFDIKTITNWNEWNVEIRLQCTEVLT